MAADGPACHAVAIPKRSLGGMGYGQPFEDRSAVVKYGKRDSERLKFQQSIANLPIGPPKILSKCSFCLQPIPDDSFRVSQSPSGVCICASCVELAAELLTHFRTGR